MGTQIFLGMPSPRMVEWIKDYYCPIVKPETHIKFVDGTEGDYLLEGQVDWQYLVAKGLVQQAGGPPTWKKQPQEVIIGTAMTSIGDNAFYNCINLMSITISNSVTSIMNYVFQECSSLTSVTIPDFITSIGYDAFSVCSKLTSMTFSGKSIATVQDMNNYSWDLPSGCVIHCTDGDITV